MFANNSLSSVLDTGKSTETLFTQCVATSSHKRTNVDIIYLQTKGGQVQRNRCQSLCIRGIMVRSKNSVLSCLCLTMSSADGAMKASVCITEALLDPTTSHSEEPFDAPCLRLFEAKSYFDYLHAPGNEYLSARFQAAMGNFAASENSTVVPGGFPWETLPKEAKVVDVGGGLGSACEEIMKENPFLKFTVQDLPNVVEEAIAVSTLTSTLKSERIYSQVTRSTGIITTPRRSQTARSRFKHTTSSPLNPSRTQISSCSGISCMTGRTQRRSRFSND